MHFTEAILREIPDDKLDVAIFDYATHRFDWDNHARDWYERLLAMPVGIRRIFPTQELDLEMHDDGADCYCSQMDGGERLVNLSIDGYRAIGASDHMKTLELAAATVVKDGPRIHPNLYDLLDHALNEADKREDTHDLRVKYVRAHPAEFVTP